ncbi:MAG TPA: hypothetical protein VFZ47_13100 [Chitinophagaceae bacterium]
MNNTIRITTFFLFALPLLIYSTAFAAVKIQDDADEWLLAKKGSAVSCIPPGTQQKESKKNTMPHPAGHQASCHFPGLATMLCVFAVRKRQCPTAFPCS